MKHKYPKDRKKRETKYAKSSKVIEQLGLDKVKEVLSTMGQYLASETFTKLSGWYVSPYVVYYLRKFKLQMGAFNDEKNDNKIKAIYQS